MRRLGLLGKGPVLLSQCLEPLARLFELPAHFIALSRHALEAGFCVAAFGDRLVPLGLELLGQGAGRGDLSGGRLAFFTEDFELPGQLFACLPKLGALFLGRVAFIYEFLGSPHQGEHFVGRADNVALRGLQQFTKLRGFPANGLPHRFAGRLSGDGFPLPLRLCHGILQAFDLLGHPGLSRLPFPLIPAFDRTCFVRGP